MIVQLVSYRSSLRADSKLRHTAEIINSSKADLILFAGHTLVSHSDVNELNKLVDNDKTIAVIEVKENKYAQANQSNFVLVVAVVALSLCPGFAAAVCFLYSTYYLFCFWRRGCSHSRWRFPLLRFIIIVAVHLVCRYCNILRQYKSELLRQPSSAYASESIG